MRYASVCDGIGAAHVAWQPLGWECAWTSEIEPFPATVVDHRYGFANLGDMTKITEEMLDARGPVELLVGGTPCQSFSVAGLRGGLADPRGNLALRFVQLAAVLKPKWIVWENVPGVLSSNKGRDFGTFLGAMAELGYGFAYRVLDAQWFGVAQRRRRVFVVAHARDWRRAAAVLFERESVFGNPPTRGAKGEDAAGSTGDGVARCVTTGESRRQDWESCNFVAEPHAIYSNKSRCDNLPPAGLSPPLKIGSNSGGNPPAVAFTKAKRAQSTTDDETWVPGEVSPTMSCFDQGDTRATTVVAFTTEQTPKFKNDCALTITRQSPSGGGQPQCVAFTQNCRDEVRQINGDGQIAGALSADSGSHQTNYVACDVHGTLASKGASETDCHTSLRARPPGQSEASTTTVVAFQQRGREGGMQLEARTDSVANCLRPPCGGRSGADCVAYDVHGIDFQNVANTGDLCGTIMGEAQKKGGEAGHGVMAAMAVRRLTPRECERLQGFPDDYTLVEYRKKPAADGPRYRALGNSMAVPVMRWIGERIAMVERLAPQANGGAA